MGHLDKKNQFQRLLFRGAPFQIIIGAKIAQNNFQRKILASKNTFFLMKNPMGLTAYLAKNQ